MLRPNEGNELFDRFRQNLWRANLLLWETGNQKGLFPFLLQKQGRLNRYFTVYYNNCLFYLQCSPSCTHQWQGSPIFFFLSTNNNLQNRYKNDEITNKGKSCRLAHSATFQSQKVSVQDFVSHESDCLNYRWKIRISPGSTSKFLTRRPHSSFSRVQLLEGPPRTWRICFKYMDAFGPIDSWEST